MPTPPPWPFTIRFAQPSASCLTRHVAGSVELALRWGVQYGTFVILSPRSSPRQDSQRGVDSNEESALIEAPHHRAPRDDAGAPTQLRHQTNGSRSPDQPRTGLARIFAFRLP